MATVLERFNHLGLAHSNQVLTACGVHVAEQFVFENSYQEYISIPKKSQKEGDTIYEVKDYPRYWQERLDYVIMLWCAGWYKEKSNG